MTGRIIVADDHPLFREGMLRTLQRLLPDASLEEAGDLAGVVHLAERGEEPDSLILDLRFPGLTRIDLLADLRRRFPRTALIVVSMVDDPQLIAEVMDAGVDGFLGKSIAPEELGEAILAIRAGEVLVRYEPSGLLPLESSALLDGLTERQLDVLRLLAQGKSNKEIGRALDISHYTVRIHVSSLLKALDVPSRTAAAVKYRAALGDGEGK
ncbi:MULTISPECIES: LuxR C-terminal-related transcriptional regulator [Pseudomonas aeruginosa group]|uniref:LuxR C-terminal-related transcriptional regulator n=1 Tax=Pseudomonas aeruginosa group TaxID=136841 RepID=UPI0005B80B47|nr:response regulator transcription factor [Pseudomonas aeruginosa]MEA8480801.1 response regulator transcription factor [Pseudomonas aeruginosa]